MDSTVIIAIQDIHLQIKGYAEKSLEERLKAAMKATIGHWLVHSEEEQFKVAIGAVLLDATQEEKERIEAELKLLRALSAAINGIPVDMGRVISEVNVDNAIGLRGLWTKAKEQDEKDTQMA